MPGPPATGRSASLVTGMGPALAREATRRALAAGPFDHVMVIGIAGGLDPALPVGLADGARAGCSSIPTGPSHQPHPARAAGGVGGLMTTDGLFDEEDVWRPILERGFGAVDMEAAGVAEVCEEAGVDWSVYRGISDRPDEHIVDQAVFALSKPDGSADPVALAKYLARDPRRAKALAHLNRCMQAAATRGRRRRLRRPVGEFAVNRRRRAGGRPSSAPRGGR